VSDRTKQEQATNDGIWLCIQELVVAHDQPTIAADILRTCGIAKAEAMQIQGRHGCFNEQISGFIESELNDE